MKRYVLLVSALLWAFSVSALAEDDLMSILEGKTQTSSSQFVENAELNNLKKLMNPSTGEQNIFFQFMGEKNYEKALFQWRSAFNGTSFQNSANGKALEGFLYFKNGLKSTGVERLFEVNSSQDIDNSIISLWKESLNGQDPVWRVVELQWNPSWSQIFGPESEMAVLLQKNYVNEDIAALTELIKKTAVDSKERNILQWQLVLNLGIKGESGKAAQVLAHLMKAKMNPIDKDLMTLTAGRLLYQNGFLDASIKYYKQIAKKSDYWFVAQEEMAWAYLRKGEPQNTMALTKTLTYPHFKGWVGVESYLLSSFASLKVCDYPGVLEAMKSLKPQFADHLVAVEKLAENANQPAAIGLLAKMQNGPVSVEKLGSEAHLLPLNVSKDETLALLVNREQHLLKEASVAEKLFANSLEFGQLQGHFEALKNQIRNKAQVARSSALQRIQILAKAELEDSKQVMQRMRIVEVEMIQQVDSASKFLQHASASSTRKGQTGSESKYAMNFSNDKELWFDELSNFKVNVKKGCSRSSAKE